MARRGGLVTCTLAVALLSSALGAQSTSDSLRIYYVGRPVGWERYAITKSDGGERLAADWSYVDRGRRIHTAATLDVSTDYTPVSLKVDRFNDTTRTPALDVSFSGRRATIVRNGATSGVDLPPVAFAISQYTPVSQHLALLRYWKAHGSPATLAVVPGDPTNPVKIRSQGIDNIAVGGKRVPLDALFHRRRSVGDRIRMARPRRPAGDVYVGGAADSQPRPCEPSSFQTTTS